MQSKLVLFPLVGDKDPVKLYCSDGWEQFCVGLCTLRNSFQLIYRSFISPLYFVQSEKYLLLQIAIKKNSKRSLSLYCNPPSPQLTQPKWLPYFLSLSLFSLILWHKETLPLLSNDCGGGGRVRVYENESKKAQSSLLVFLHNLCLPVD